jgi:hypothetical protein
MVLPVRIEHALDVAVQRPHDANPRPDILGPPVVKRDRQRFTPAGFLERRAGGGSTLAAAPVFRKRNQRPRQLIIVGGT